MDDDLPAAARSRPRFGLISQPGCAALLLAVSAVLIFGIGTSAPPWRPTGYVPMLAALALGWWAQREFGRDLTVIAACLALISSISVEADISWTNIARMGAVLSAVVIGPWLVTRRWFGDDTIVFPRRRGRRWSRVEWSWLVVVVLVAWIVLPMYFMGTGVYRNWPPVTEWHEVLRLFIGVNAVGIWDELFFICTVFALLRKHLGFWSANAVTSIIFVSFLWELGYRSIGPVLTIPFALMQAFVFTRTKSLPYTVTVHLLFDAVVFMTIVAAHHPQLRFVFPVV